MNKKKVLNLLGFAYLLIGILLIFNSFQGITGFAIFEGADISYGAFLGIVFVLIGILVVYTSGLLKRPPTYWEKREILTEKLHLTDEQAERLLKGEEVERLEKNSKYELDTYFRLDTGGKLHVVVGSIGGPEKREVKSREGKKVHAAGYQEGFKALRKLRKDSLEAGRSLGLQEVDIYGTQFLNGPLYDLLKSPRYGFEDTQISTSMVSPDGRMETLDAVVKRYRLDKEEEE